MTRRRTLGFTLVEVLTAAAIAAIAFGGLGSLLFQTLQASRMAVQQTEAVHLAQARMEFCLSQVWSQAAAGAGTIGIYQCSWSVSAPLENGTCSVVSVAIWTDTRGIEHRVELASLTPSRL